MPSRVLFVTLSNIGDVIMTTPALIALHNAFPQAVVDIVADPRSSAIFEACPFLGTLFHRHKQAKLRGTWNLVRQLRKQHYNAIVDLRTDIIPWLLRGSNRSARWCAPTHGPHAVQQHMAVVNRIIEEKRETPSTQVWISAADRDYARDVMHAQPQGRWLAVAPGANWPGKIWAALRYAELLSLSAKDFCGALLLGGPADRAIAQTVKAHSTLHCLDLTGATSLTQAAALLDSAAVFIGNDSGLGHLAAARGVPTLTLFGPGRPERYRPWHRQGQVVLAPSRDLGALEVSTVWDALRTMITATNR
jgi:heptosyltransferase III